MGFKPSIFVNPRRIQSALWLLAALTLTIALVRYLGLSADASASQWRVRSLWRKAGRASLHDHIKVAEAAWARTVKERHEVIKQDFGVVDRMDFFPAESEVKFYNRPYTIWDFIPASWACPHEMERVGKLGAGGKWVCGMSRLAATSKARANRRAGKNKKPGVNSDGDDDEEEDYTLVGQTKLGDGTGGVIADYAASVTGNNKPHTQKEKEVKEKTANVEKARKYGQGPLADQETRPPCVMYSLGVGGNHAGKPFDQRVSSFEDGMLSRTKCELWAYDAAEGVDFVARLDPLNCERATFERVEISSEVNATVATSVTKSHEGGHQVPVYRIRDLMSQNGHVYIDLLKIDLDFGEFDALDALSQDFPAAQGIEFPVGQMIVDVHLDNMGKDTKAGRMNPLRFLKWWERLEARGMRPVWAEINLAAVTMASPEQRSPYRATYTFLNVHDSRSIIFGGAATRSGVASTQSGRDPVWH